MFRLWPVLLMAAPFVVAAISWVFEAAPEKVAVRIAQAAPVAPFFRPHYDGASNVSGAAGWNWSRICACRNRP
jgi:hypothetical protein